MDLLTSLAAGLVVAAALSAIAYTAAALAATILWQRQRPGAGGYAPPVSVLKPLCGAEAELYENLRSFCEQDYPCYEVIFGVRDPGDPAIAVVERLKRELPQRDIVLVVDERLVGVNYKISNLTNILSHARHEHLAISDSDIRVGPGYLSRVMDGLGDPGVGVVTCLYRGRPTGTLWSHLGALFIDAWFLPSVLVGRAMGFGSFCFGASMALRRDVLEQIGGFESLAWQLADDYVLGERIRANGLRVLLSSYLVETTVDEPGLRALFQHELRWARTIRTVQPVGHAFSFITYAIALSCLAAPLLASPWAAVMPAAAVALRAAIYLAVNRDRPGTALFATLLLPLRGFAALLVWAASFGSRHVSWRQQQLSVQSDGRMSHRDQARAWAGAAGATRERELRS